ncbi:MAG: hypothetical protein F2793_06155 [Actinobacteria bacterium]|uniref:Unannotated protein n=1 Tax=freshwater metagenome TaxID=449393 RepID=A0A6J7EKB4_9ZZZZ|nr:hypothetical protein [Actinomycetota bacterium]
MLGLLLLGVSVSVTGCGTSDSGVSNTDGATQDDFEINPDPAKPDVVDPVAPEPGATDLIGAAVAPGTADVSKLAGTHARGGTTSTVRLAVWD